MSRLQVLVGSPRRTLGALAVVLAAVGITIGSSAGFVAASANPENTFSSGTLTIDNSAEGAAILDAANLIPGGASKIGYVDIRNSGSMEGVFRLSQTIADEGAVGADKLVDRLILSIVDCGRWTTTTAPTCGSVVTVYSGRLSAFGDPKELAAPFAAGDKHRFRFTVRLDDQTPNALQGVTAKVRYDWDAVQTGA